MILVIPVVAYYGDFGFASHRRLAWGGADAFKLLSELLEAQKKTRKTSIENDTVNWRCIGCAVMGSELRYNNYSNQKMAVEIPFPPTNSGPHFS